MDSFAVNLFTSRPLLTVLVVSRKRCTLGLFLGSLGIICTVALFSLLGDLVLSTSSILPSPKRQFGDVSASALLEGSGESLSNSLDSESDDVTVLSLAGCSSLSDKLSLVEVMGSKTSGDLLDVSPSLS